MEVAKIYTEFSSNLLSLINSKVKNQEDSKDILHNVFEKITINIKKLSSEEKLKSWIYTITRNAINDYYRDNGKFSKSSTTLEIEEIVEVSDDTLLQRMEDCVLPFIDQLPEKYKEIIYESEIKGIAQKSLADKYNIPYPSVRSRVQRGRSQLKNIFLECCRFEQDSRGGVIAMISKKNCKDDC